MKKKRVWIALSAKCERCGVELKTGRCDGKHNEAGPRTSEETAAPHGSGAPNLVANPSRPAEAPTEPGSPSGADLARELGELIAQAGGRVWFHQRDCRVWKRGAGWGPCDKGCGPRKRAKR